jgi:RNA polymerase primary sigma factor/RNA polymerase sigma factor
MVARYNSECIELLRNQLLFAPTGVRRRNIFRLERLISSLSPERRYPYEYIYHKITNYRPEQNAVITLSGKELLDDLLKLLSALSDSIDIKAKDVAEPVLTVPDLMGRYGVSAKTIYRWRKRGLVGYEFVFADGKKRIGFKLSSIQEFEEHSKSQLSKSGSFSLVEDDEKANIIEEARRLIESGMTVFSEVVAGVAQKVGRSRETIRYMLKKHEQDNPDHRLFADLMNPLSDADREAIFRLYQIGVPMRALCKEYRRNRSSIYRLIYQTKSHEILGEEISYVYNPEFDNPGAHEKIMEGEDEVVVKPHRMPAAEPEIPEDLPIYLRDLHRKAKLLTREEELALFRRFNYLKHVIAMLRERLKVAGPRAEIINEIESLYQRAIDIKQRIIRANLRLVVAIAKRHTGHTMDFNTLVSDGNLSLMQAVEKFDYGKGNRFSTYASWAIIKNYAKSIPEESSLQEQFRTSTPEMLELVPGAATTREPSKTELVEGFKKLLGRVMRTLSDREREVIIARFGLKNNGVPATLEEIGSTFDLSKERIRQIEAKALKKLRTELDIDQVDSLLG